MKCGYIKSNGEQCEANAINNGKFCFWHNPDISAEEKRDAQAKGGKANKIEVAAPLPPIKVKTSNDVVELLSDTIGRVRSGDLDIKIANCIGYLSGHLLRAFEVTDLENRLEFVEREVKEKILKIK